MKNNKINYITLAVSIALSVNVFAQEETQPTSQASASDKFSERIQILGHQEKLRTEAGSATLIGELELEKFKFDDLNRILYSVPGVNIREEDGYGLRPNIGFRGVTPDRSKKITTLEDGILIGPAPYSAPAAYYFPIINKITALEVFKGPAAIKYGPYTVAGALNLVTRQVPDVAEGAIDIALGTDGYGKAIAHYGNTHGKFGYLVEAIHIEADGFKELDGGGDTGFDKNDIQVKFKYDFSNDNYDQILQLKLDYADEDSDETYLGLTDDDFRDNPNRRYVTSANDRFTSDHEQAHLTHFIGNDKFDVTTNIYRNNFDRSWFRLDNFQQGGFIEADLQEVLANPEEGLNAAFYEILTGQRDSSIAAENLIIVDNKRKFFSQGIQTELYLYQDLFGKKNVFNAGIRVHKDQIKRRHTEDTFLIRNGELVSDGSETRPTTTNLEETTAISVFFKDTITLNKLDLTFGLRGEFIDGFFQNQAPGEEGNFLQKDTTVWLPSFSGFYSISDQLGVFFGIHEGFIPTSPAEPTDVEIESSINYELGARYNNGNTKVEAVTFFHDIENLKESCSASVSSACTDILDSEFNSGEASLLGFEFSAQHTFAVSDSFDLPISLNYTYTKGEFEEDFISDFPLWGEVESGDSLPYLPEHQLTFKIGLAANDWQVNLATRYTDELLEASGEGVTLSGAKTKAITIVDFSASYDVNVNSNVYFKVDNIFDRQEIVGRRPFGARPGKPLTAIVGYKYSF